MDNLELNEGASAPGANTIEENFVKIPNIKEIQSEISLLDITSNEYYKYLIEFSEYLITQKGKLINKINNYKDQLIYEYNQLLINKDFQKPLKYETESDFVNSTEKDVNLMKRINKIYSQLFASIKHNLEILKIFFTKFLKYYDNTEEHSTKDKPVQDFLLEEFKNIVKSWLFINLDFDKFDFEEALSRGEYEPNFKTFVSNEFKKKNFSLDIICPKGEVLEPKDQKKLKEQKDKDIVLLSENRSNLIKLHIENAGSISNYTGDRLEFIKLKKLYLENTIIPNNNFYKKTKNLEKLIIKSFPNFQLDILENLPERLKELHLEKSNLVNFEVESIFKCILTNNKNILQNLEYLSFAGNNISRVDLTILATKQVFNGLQAMNFQKNKIYKFIFNPENFKNLKFINFCKNYLNKSFLSNIQNIASLETANGFLFEPELCENYYNKLKEKLKINENKLFITKYLNFSFMPKVQTLKYFEDFIINQQIITNLKKLDLSYNGLNCDLFFKFVNQNNGFPNLRSLNLNGNELDDTFFEKCLEYKSFPKLEHLYLNSNKIGDSKTKVNYKDDIPIDEKYNKNDDRVLIYKLRLLYIFIQKNVNLTKLTITKNPISELYTVVPPEQNNDADKSSKYIKRQENNIIIINCLFSLLIKIRDELLNKEEEKKKGRKRFNLRFYCRSNVNKNSENYPYSNKPIIKK